MTLSSAYAERALGPGWVNSPLWVIVRNGTGELREECLQPDEQNEQMIQLYLISESVHRAMCAAVNKAIGR